MLDHILFVRPVECYECVKFQISRSQSNFGSHSNLIVMPVVSTKQVFSQVLQVHIKFQIPRSQSNFGLHSNLVVMSIVSTKQVFSQVLRVQSKLFSEGKGFLLCYTEKEV